MVILRTSAQSFLQLWQNYLTETRRNASEVYGRCQLYSLFLRMCMNTHASRNISSLDSLVLSANSSKSIMNKKVVGHNLLSTNQYGFRSVRFTNYVLTLITHRMSEVLSNVINDKLITRVICLDKSKPCDKVWHRGLLHKHSNFGIRVLGIIKFFLTCRSMKIFVNSQSY